MPALLPIAAASRRLALAPLLLALFAAMPAAAGPVSEPPAATAPADPALLDTLFAQLRRAPDASAAGTIARRIWQHWLTPPDPVLAARMQLVLAAREAGDHSGALALLDQLVADYPDYAEGWNQRATLRYAQRDFEASLADIDKVLALEPRHFGALAGRALVHLATGRRALALRDMAAALAIHPFLAEKALFPELVQDITRI